uniref:Uncharacterized protein n=1 Tax=Anopheles atroparvus TaxID=41427 RepID=A0A182J4M7_ANOAO
LLVEDTNTTSLLSSTTGTTKTINGNNNYELCEFDAKVPTYSWQTTRVSNNRCNSSLRWFDVGSMTPEKESNAMPLFGDRWRKSPPNANRPPGSVQQPLSGSESLDGTGSANIQTLSRAGGSGTSSRATGSTSTTTTTTGTIATTVLGGPVAGSSGVTGPGPPPEKGASSVVKCTVVHRLHGMAGGLGCSADTESGLGGGSVVSSAKKRQQRSRITYDREQGVRFYRGTEITDSNDCDCEDI